MSTVFEIFLRFGEWHWELKHQNGAVLAQSYKGYPSRSNARRAIKSVAAYAPFAHIKVREIETADVIEVASLS